MNLSAVIIAKNEENLIADCIDGLSFCDEIVVIDNESTDRTREIAESLGAKVYTDKGRDFAKRRNLGRDKAKGTWILYIDADERVSEQLKEEILLVTTQNDPKAAYRIPRRDYRFGNVRWENVEYHQRLFEKRYLVEWFGALHESSKVNGKVGELTGELKHYTHRSLEQMLNKTLEWSDTEAKLRLEHNHPQMTWWRFPRVMLTGFYTSYIKEKGYKVGTAGLIEGLFQAYSMFITYARLWELQNDQKK